MGRIEPVSGIVIDDEARTFEVCGVHMVVGNLQRSPYSPAHQRDRAATPAAIVAIIEDGNPGFYDRMAPAFPESIHATLLCGENGWWVDVAVWPGDPEFSEGLSFSLPDGPWNPYEGHTADDLLMFWRQTCARRDAPPDWEAENEPGPFGGCVPGTWIWYEDEPVDV